MFRVLSSSLANLTLSSSSPAGLKPKVPPKISLIQRLAAYGNILKVTFSLQLDVKSATFNCRKWQRMTITEKDVKKLWGLAAGRCSYPGCDQECIRFLDSKDPTVIGEMAHVIAKKPNGPRGISTGGTDTYENLILLCPTHHTEIDKGPTGKFSIDLLYKWKSTHEERVRQSFKSPKFSDRKTLAHCLKRLLIENKTIWKQYGPDSQEATMNPLSNLAKIWIFRKLNTMIPNNRKIINMIEQNKELIDLVDYVYCTEFIEHAEGFEQNCYVRTEGIPRFPVNFERMVDRYVGIQ